MEFRIITYNIFGARLTNGRELARSLKKYNPDFIGLQEVDRNTKRSKFRDVVQEMAQEGDVKFLCGDFNLLPMTEFYVKIRKDWNDSYFQGRDLENKKNSENRKLETARIDYMMAKKTMIAALRRVFILMMIQGIGLNCQIICRIWRFLRWSKFLENDFEIFEIE